MLPPSFVTKGRAKAVWMTFKRTSVSEMSVITNVNPTTGEVEENGFYRARQGSSAIDQPTGNAFIITDTSVSLQNPVSSAAATYILSYTY